MQHVTVILLVHETISVMKQLANVNVKHRLTEGRVISANQAPGTIQNVNGVSAMVMPIHVIHALVLVSTAEILHLGIIVIGKLFCFHLLPDGVVCGLVVNVLTCSVSGNIFGSYRRSPGVFFV